ncbi:hypothetical protein SASPL_124367 [Salvia splendens]|uniref:Uncharacterized protein n=1 Tax=Salvia splendens TaxID=180675 RepID=A0A8X8XSW5_SALSN|nr:malonyl-coenzyme:anthocyanin 5-O-glucoside-6'''-O-malonyltransferase-like [Salvia splendens]KAG6416926.1 hypothetical protein SASPL_124367 [Salvia splendens]
MSSQATLFPGRGICIGLSNHHSLGFVKAWAMVNKSGDDEAFVSKSGESLPIFERSSVFGDSSRLDGIFWNVMKNIPLKTALSNPFPTNRVRASFILRQSDIEKLKNLILSARPNLVRVSTFVVAAAYVWTEDGFVVAAEAIGGEMRSKIYDGDEFLKSPENRLSEVPKLKGVRVLVASGSPKFDLTEADFRWGEARKVEVMSLDDTGKYSMSLCNSGGGGLVVGMSLPKEMMVAFASMFKDGLKL